MASVSRRSFFRRAVGLTPPLRPPQSNDETVKAHCSGCGDCIAACPEKIIVFDRARLPALSFSAGQCVFCGRCAAVCKEAVFDRGLPMSLPAVATVGDACLVRDGVFCQHCRDVCDENAIVFSPSPSVPPVVAAAACSGCGGCVAVCPAGALTVSAVA